MWEIVHDVDAAKRLFDYLKPSFKPFQGRVRKRSYRRAIQAAENLLKHFKNIAELVPVVGPHVKAILNLALVILAKIEEVHAFKAGRSALSKRLAAVLELVKSVLCDPNASSVPKLIADLQIFEQILRDIEGFLLEHAGKCRFRDFATSKFPLLSAEIYSYQDELDRAINYFLLRCAVQTRIDMNNLRTELLDLNKNTQEQLRTIGRELFSLREKMRSSQEVSTTSSIDSLEIDHRNDIPPSYAAACQEKGAFVKNHAVEVSRLTS